MARMPRSLFFPPKDPRLAAKISIVSPAAFRRSITTLKRDGLTLREKRALVLARTRAAVQLRRRNLSMRERRQFRTISRMKLPRITSRKRS